MKRLLGKLLAAEILLLTLALLSGCSAPSPRDFGGNWSHVNHFSSTVEAIPLQRPYEYFASPLDSTLKNMLSRWSKDTKMHLDYRFPDDFTLYKPVSSIHTPDVETALSELNGIYVKEGIFIAVRNGKLVVTGVTPDSVPSAGLAPRKPAIDSPHAPGTPPDSTPAMRVGKFVGVSKPART